MNHLGGGCRFKIQHFSKIAAINCLIKEEENIRRQHSRNVLFESQSKVVLVFRGFIWWYVKILMFVC